MSEILFSCACKFSKPTEFSDATILDICGYHAERERSLCVEKAGLTRRTALLLEVEPRITNILAGVPTRDLDEYIVRVLRELDP